MTIIRPDQPEIAMTYKDRYKGGTALIVLGGLSGATWQEIRQSVKPDVILGANGVVFEIPELDYWLCSENMTYSHKQFMAGNKEFIEHERMFQCTTPKVRLMSHRSWHLLEDKANAIRIRRKGFEIEDIPTDYTFREYGEGLHGGWALKRKGIGAQVLVGTVGMQLIHWAGVLGCSQVHTIGFDLCFRNPNKHHFYDYPIYHPDRYRTAAMFTEYKGLQTTWTWIECALNMKMLSPYFERDGIEWIDHSDGLLEVIE